MRYTIEQLIHDMPIGSIFTVAQLPMSFKGDSPYILQTGSLVEPIDRLQPIRNYIELPQHKYDLFDSYILLVIDGNLCAVFGMTGHIAHDQKILTKLF